MRRGRATERGGLQEAVPDTGEGAKASMLCVVCGREVHHKARVGGVQELPERPLPELAAEEG